MDAKALKNSDGRRRPGIALGELISIVVAICFLVPLPILLSLEYWHFGPSISPLCIIDSLGAAGVSILGLLWYRWLWPLVDTEVYRVLRVDRLLLAATSWSAVAYLAIWWLCSQCMGGTVERAAVALLAVAMPTVNYYLIQGARQEGRRWRYPDCKPTGPPFRKITCIGLPILIVAGLVIGYFGCVRPTRRLWDIPYDAAPEESRELSHQVLRLPFGSHDAFLLLGKTGDETSVPRLIWALAWAPGPEVRACTWSHGFDALAAITNQSVGRTQAEWRAWYAANRHKSRLEWIADGFRQSGVEVTVEGSPSGVRALLAAMSPGKKWDCRRRNAILLLESFDREMVTREVTDAARTGTPDQKRGAIRAAKTFDLRGAEAIFHDLSKDASRSVRVPALVRLSEGNLGRVKSPAGSALRTSELDWFPTAWGTVSEDGVLYVPTVRNHLAAYRMETRTILWRTAIKERGSAVYVDGGDVYVTVPDGTLYRVRATDGEIVWSSPRSNAGKSKFYGALACDGDYVVCSNDRVFVCSKADGKEMASAPGRLLGVSDGAAVASEGETVHFYELPDLAQRASFASEGDIMEAGFSGSTVALLVRGVKGSRHPQDECPSWLEGWSLETGSRVWGPLPIGKWGARDECRIQTNPDACYVSLDEVVSAVRFTDGRLLWESAPGGRLLHAGKLIVLNSSALRGLWVMDARNGRVLARYQQDVRGSYFNNVYVHRDELHVIGTDGTTHVFRLPDVPADSAPGM